METERAMTKLYTLSISVKSGILAMMRCTESWSSHYSPAYGLPPSSIHAIFVGYEISDPFILHMQSEVWIN